MTDMDLNMFSTLKKSTARDDFDILTRELLNINSNIQEFKQRNKV